ncbi:MAG: hypothetical protein HY738_07360 [Bacteroidia bacterium]|nr:hypothetical protein [Bacteroidia bacterium]
MQAINKNYLCPACKGHLRVGDKIILTVKRPNDTGGLVLLSPKLGDYSVATHQDFQLAKGEHLEVFCPICHTNLAAEDVSRNLAKILMVDENRKISNILFSEIVGEHCTYKIAGNHRVESFGEDMETYINFFGETPKYYY